MVRAAWLLSVGGLMVIPLASLGGVARIPREFSSDAGEKKRSKFLSVTC